MRAQADALAAHVAGSCAAASLKLQQDPHQAKAGSVALRGLQLASLQLLQTSVLSPVPHRPPFLAQALQLFQAARWVWVDSCAVVACKRCCWQLCWRRQLLMCAACGLVLHLPRAARLVRVDPGMGLLFASVAGSRL
jgi:hypothetical protein